MDVARPTGSDDTRDARGVAVADFDGDGRLDLAVNNNAAAPAIFFNRSPASGHWLRFILRGTVSNRDAVGARVRLEVDGKARHRRVEAGSGYASQSSLAVHFGLGSAVAVNSVEITWPSGRVQHLDASSWGIDQTLQLEEPTE